MNELPLISVIIPTFNRRTLLEKLLASLEGQTYPRDRYEVLVINDSSTDDTEAFLGRFAKGRGNFRFITQDHAGSYGARNRGITLARGDILAFTDDDCVATPVWLAALAGAFARRPDALGVQGSTRSIPEMMTPLTHQIVRPRGSHLYETCNIAYRAEILRALKGFDGTIVYGFGDTILAARILQRGPIIFEGKAAIIHWPVPRLFRGKKEWQILMSGEWKLANACPGFYWRHRGPGFLGGVLIQWLIGNTLKELLQCARWLWKDSRLYLLFARKLLAERWLLLTILPDFSRQRRKPAAMPGRRGR